MKFDLNEVKRFEQHPVWQYLLSQIQRERDEALAALQNAPKDTIWAKTDNGIKCMRQGVELIQGQVDTLTRMTAIVDMLKEQMEGGRDA